MTNIIKEGDHVIFDINRGEKIWFIIANAKTYVEKCSMKRLYVLLSHIYIEGIALNSFVYCMVSLMDNSSFMQESEIGKCLLFRQAAHWLSLRVLV